MKSAIETQETHIAAIVETKLENIPPYVKGYKWITKNRTNREGGGVALLIRDDMINRVSEVTDTEDVDQEIIWIQTKDQNRKLSIGVFYGLQEKEKREEITRQYAQLTAQILKLKEEGEVILMGDFNSKLKIEMREACQEISPNGREMQKMIDQTGIKVTTMRAQKGIWTRVNRSNPQERSIIDYVLMTERADENTYDIMIDETGEMRIKGRRESDHNTITATTRIQKTTKTTKRRIWKLNNEKGWRTFNEEIQKQEKDIKNYQQLERAIYNTMLKTVGATTVTIGKYKNKEGQAIKEAREKRRQKKKEYNEACKNNREDKRERLADYLKSQHELRQAIENQNRDNTQKTIEKIIEEGGAKSQNFWKIRRKILGSKADLKYDLVTEEGENIQNKEEAKNYIADYFENLYQARQGRPEYQEWTERISKTVKDIEEDLKNCPPIEPITEQELNHVIKALKRKKSTGPDHIPNEAFIEATRGTRRIYRKILNKIAEKQEIPTKWQEGEIVRIYKGKGTKGKCSNERGITLASNFGKVYERIINRRAMEKVNMTENQAGGRKGRATVDHIRALCDLIQIGRKERKPTCVTFLDVTKAYDKAWIDAILYVLHKNGVKDNTWTAIKRLNENLTAKVQTKYGLTRSIRMTDSIRQGGVLSVLLYALMMDEISKEIKAANHGIKLPNTDNKEGCLLWMDDVALIANNKEEMQQMLDKTDDIAKRYHIEFGKDKSKTMTVGPTKKEEPKFNLGNMELERTEKYKYLGTTLNERLTISHHIKETVNKAEATYQTIIMIAKDQNFAGVEMGVIWKLIETCLIPIITYGGETWIMTKKEKKELNETLDNILRRILKTPQSTPREVLYMETGLLDPETVTDKNRINMWKRLKQKPSDLQDQLNNIEGKKMWITNTKETCIGYRIREEDLTGPKAETERTIIENVEKTFKKRIEENGNNKSKVQYLKQGIGDWKPGVRAAYMEKLNRDDSSTIFQARTRMLRVKNNYRNKYRDNICRMCGSEEETQEHILEMCEQNCRENTICMNYIFSDDIRTLKEVARKIRMTIQRLNIIQ